MHALKLTKSRDLRIDQYIWLIFVSFQIFIFSTSHGPFEEDFEQCVTYKFYTAPWQEKAYSFFNLVTNFVIPLIILIFSYTSALRRLRRKS